MTEYDTIQELKEAVVKSLITNHDFLAEVAESTVEESLTEEQGMWNVNAEADDIANYLASDDDDE